MRYSQTNGGRGRQVFLLCTISAGKGNGTGFRRAEEVYAIRSSYNLNYTDGKFRRFRALRRGDRRSTGTSELDYNVSEDERYAYVRLWSDKRNLSRYIHVMIRQEDFK